MGHGLTRNHLGGRLYDLYCRPPSEHDQDFWFQVWRPSLVVHLSYTAYGVYSSYYKTNTVASVFLYVYLKLFAWRDVFQTILSNCQLVLPLFSHSTQFPEINRKILTFSVFYCKKHPQWVVHTFDLDFE